MAIGVHVHFGQRQVHRLLGTDALLYRAGVETCNSQLGGLKGDFTHAGEHGLGLGLVALDLVDALGAALIGHSLQVLGALDTRGQLLRGCAALRPHH